MAHVYEVHTSDGRSYEVTVQYHHEDHDDQSFKKHLIDVLKSSAVRVVSDLIVHRYIYRGRR